MKIHKNAALTKNQRQNIKEMYLTGEYSQAELAKQFKVHRKTIGKWVNRDSQEDLSSRPKKPFSSITKEFEDAVKSYRGDSLTSHHGKIRIAFELKEQYPCSNPSNVYLILKRANLNQEKSSSNKVSAKIPVGKHRTQMDIQQLPAIEGNEGFEYKISIIHLSTRIKYSEIHDNYESKTIAAVYERALDNLPPFL